MFVPSLYRVLYINIANIFWNAFLSNQQHHNHNHTDDDLNNCYNNDDPLNHSTTTTTTTTPNNSSLSFSSSSNHEILQNNKNETLSIQNDKQVEQERKDNYMAPYFNINDNETSSSSSPSESKSVPPGKESHPAYYYLVTVLREKQQRVLYRRYSQFRWLYEQIKDYRAPPPVDDIIMPDLEPNVMPPKTCPWQKIDDVFAQNRLEQLHDFLTSILIRPGIASHPAVLQFLELETSSTG
jgi:hypothetical protein